MKKLFLLLLTCCIITGFGAVQSVKADTLALSLVLDGSGSISSYNWTSQLQAYADAITAVVPRDGTVALNIIQFSTSAVQEIGFTVIDTTTLSTFTNALLAITQQNGSTNTSAGIDLAVSTLTAFDTTDSFDRWVIDVSTDGQWNMGYNPYTAAVTAVDTYGVDAVNAIGIGTTTAFNYGTNSFALQADWNNFSDVLAEKLSREITATPEPATMMLFGIGLLSLAGIRRKK
ncbi:DUF1194 domain-containing protein [uncultured Desulfobacter sp.]|uniref:DUF1194 domain-containing protein n=1 Tax=uncultured Desulfobacter sp. TaxID=240139 RepID=UPI002AAB17B4|nr:DUF1194 domain-containing protein [uncultured Desulfobacter sp.]